MMVRSLWILASGCRGLRSGRCGPGNRQECRRPRPAPRRGACTGRASQCSPSSTTRRAAPRNDRGNRRLGPALRGVARLCARMELGRSARRPGGHPRRQEHQPRHSEQGREWRVRFARQDARMARAGGRGARRAGRSGPCAPMRKGRTTAAGWRSRGWAERRASSRWCRRGRGKATSARAIADGKLPDCLRRIRREIVPVEIEIACRSRSRGSPRSPARPKRPR